MVEVRAGWGCYTGRVLLRMLALCLVPRVDHCLDLELMMDISGCLNLCYLDYCCMLEAGEAELVGYSWEMGVVGYWAPEVVCCKTEVMLVLVCSRMTVTTAEMIHCYKMVVTGLELRATDC